MGLHEAGGGPRSQGSCQAQSTRSDVDLRRRSSRMKLAPPPGDRAGTGMAPFAGHTPRASNGGLAMVIGKAL